LINCWKEMLITLMSTYFLSDPCTVKGMLCVCVIYIYIYIYTHTHTHNKERHAHTHTS